MEFLSVVFAVLLALGVNEWRESRSKTQLADTARRNIVMEIEKNRRAMNGVLADHESYVDAIRSRLADINNSIVDATFSANYHFELLTTTAWDAAVLIQAVNHMEYQLVSDISDLYSTQKLYSDLCNQFMLNLLNPDVVTDSESEKTALSKHLFFFQNLVSLSKQLAGSYDAFLAAYGEAGKSE